jgi:hypothetical protein
VRELLLWPFYFERSWKKGKRGNLGEWVKNWVGRREKYGASSTLLKELKDEDPVAYQNILRLGGAQGFIADD